jgi:hypothetical protein
MENIPLPTYTTTGDTLKYTNNLKNEIEFININKYQISNILIIYIHIKYNMIVNYENNLNISIIY